MAYKFGQALQNMKHEGFTENIYSHWYRTLRHQK
jgi:hypothetical protein